MILRPFSPERDGPDMHAVFGDEESCRYLMRGATASIEETVSLLREYTTGIEDASWAISETEGGPCLGRVALIPRERNIWEAACMTTPAAQGKGYATRALARVIDDFFETRGMARVYADIDPENFASIRVFQKLGFAHEGVLRGTWKTHIGRRDAVIMGLLDDDPRIWRQEGWR